MKTVLSGILEAICLIIVFPFWFVYTAAMVLYDLFMDWWNRIDTH